MKNTIKLACLVGALALVSQGAMAAGFKVRGGMTSNNYELVDGNGATFASTTFNGTSLGVTWLMDDTTYLDYAMSNGTGTYDRPTYIGDITRSDWALVLGNNTITSSGNVGNTYIGWKSGNSKLTPPTTANPAALHLDFTASGLILGGGFAFPFKDAGALGINAGIGIMSGKYDAHYQGGTIVYPTYSTTYSSAVSSYQADNSFGFSYGIGYSYPITKSFGVAVDYKGNAYTYTYNSGLTSEFTLVEKMSTLGASVYATF